ncbi:MAG: neutral/alkaline non-lysosomal ceramidase N-terminal domain-containing protein [Candidatus Harrisonbacteria bacterium]|nr:neutral/alkaline non-lysosomal ceramidase N-terminal domain-containing protein [Candidatus Harrisonbacteria bacterium]
MLRKRWWLIKRVLVYFPLFSVLLTFILLSRHWHVLMWLVNFPEPTTFSPRVIKYDFSSFGSPIKAGFSKQDITPPRFSWVAGYYPPHPAFSIKDRLWVKSLALQDKNGNIVVIVSCDLIGLFPDEINKISDEVRLVHRDKIFISTTHTHSGPDTLGLWGIPMTSGKNKRYMKLVRAAIAKSIDESVASLQRSTIRFGQGEFRGYAHGREENPADAEVFVIQVLVSSMPVTLVNYACHPDVVQGLQISKDFPNFLEQRLARFIGGEVIFIPGAIGGVQPPENLEGETYFVKKLGEDLADAIVRIMKSPIIPSFTDIKLKKIKIEAPFENKQELYFAVKTKMVPNFLSKNGLVSAEVGKIQIGPAEILTVPGELFPKIWWQVKPKIHGNPKMIFGLTNGEFGYILLPEDVKSGKHKYHASMSVGPKFGEEIRGAMQGLAAPKMD